MILVQQQVVTFVWQQKTAVLTVGAGFFCEYLEILFVGKTGHSITQAHIYVGQIGGKSVCAVTTQLLIVINYPIYITGLADTRLARKASVYFNSADVVLAWNRSQAQSVTTIIEVLIKFWIKFVTISVSKQTEEFSRSGQGQQPHGRERIATAGPP